MHYRVYVFNIANLILISVFSRNVTSCRDILRECASIINNEIMTLRALSYEKTIMKTINRTINVHFLAIARDLDLPKIIEDLFDNDYQSQNLKRESY